ncbi:DNA polymerase III subunit delta [Tepidiphilus baoligensis]|uniref:DNA polymerase III subunit delta n=1 Tax=Tepidiphilus baoligensis TaxID=2698687 RepID=A0ABX1QMH4_9PROT|nr:DNA polymerase III subunit delta [Tepidiphilus baoligensis]NMH16616.1 DNA polymerase III subunit delta [Tepidiphilus baoligensis]
MKLPLERLTRHLERQTLEPVWAVYGDEPLLVLEATDAVRARARALGFDERLVFTVEPGFSWERLAQESDSLSLFASRRLIELRLPQGKPGTEGAAWLGERVKNPLPETILLVTLGELDWQARKSAWFTALERHAVVVEANAPPRERLPEWWRERLARQRQSASPELLRLLAERTEGNLLAARQELEKLALLFPEGPLPEEEVCTAVFDLARYDPDALRQAMLEGDCVRALRLLRTLTAEGCAMPLLLWAIAAALRLIAGAQETLARGAPLEVFFRQERVFRPEEKRAIERSARRLPPLRAALTACARLDRIAKGAEAGDFVPEAERLLLSLGTAPPRGRAA